LVENNRDKRAESFNNNSALLMPVQKTATETATVREDYVST